MSKFIQQQNNNPKDPKPLWNLGCLVVCVLASVCVIGSRNADIQPELVNLAQGVLVAYIKVEGDRKR